MKTKYVDEQIELFLKKLWHRANEYENLADKELTDNLKYKYQKRCYRLRRFYASVYKRYKTKQRENSSNYVFKK